MTKMVLLTTLALVAPAALAATGPGGFTYEGRVYDASTNEPSGDTVTFRMEIVNPANNCVLYRETSDSKNLGLTAGFFAVNLGSQAGSVNTLDTALSNKTMINGDGCTYTPANGSGRKLRVFIVKDGTADQLSPEVDLTSAPYAMQADTLQGMGPADFVQATNTTQRTRMGQIVTAAAAASTNGQTLVFSGGAWGIGTPTETDPTVQAFAKSGLPTCAVNEVLKSDGTTLTCVTDTSGGTPADATSSTKGIVAINTSTGLSVSGGTVSLANTAVTPASYAKVTVDAQGRVTAGSALAAGDIPSLDASKITTGVLNSAQIPAIAAGDIPALDASKVTTGTFSSSQIPNLDASKITSGNLSVPNVSATTASAQTVRVFDADNSNKATIQTPAVLSADYTLTLPADDGTAGQALITDGSGNLSWAAMGGGGTVTSVDLSLPGIFSVSGGPVTGSGTISATLSSQSQNMVFASPNGGAGAPVFRGLVPNDIPPLDATQITTGTINPARLPAGIGSQWTTSGSMIYYNTGKVGVGTASPNANLDVQATTNTASGTQIATMTYMTANPSSGGSGSYYGAQFASDFSSAQSVSGSNVGVLGQSDVSGLGVITNAIGVKGLTRSTNTGTTSNAIGGSFGVNQTTGTITNAIGGDFSVNQTGGTIASAYGVRIGTVAGTTKYSLYSTDSSAPSYFAGKLGLGVTSPVLKLDVNGAIKIANDATTCDGTIAGAMRYNGGAIEFCNGTAWGALGGGGGGNVSNGGNSFAGDMTLGTNDTFDLNFKTSNSSRMTVDTAGNVGVGINTPAERLHVHGGNVAVSGDGQPAISIVNGSNTMNDAPMLRMERSRGTVMSQANAQAGDTLGVINFSSYQVTNDSASIRAYASENHGVSFGGGDLAFLTRANGGGARQERMRITENGNIGVATMNPMSKFHVAGTITAGTFGSGGGELSLAGGTGGTGVTLKGPSSGTAYTLTFPPAGPTANQVLQSDASGNLSWTAMGSGGGIVNGGNSFGTTMEIGANDGYDLKLKAGGANHMTIAQNGNVGIGESMPGAKLHTKGGSVMFLRDDNTDMVVNVAAGGSNQWISPMIELKRMGSTFMSSPNGSGAALGAINFSSGSKDYSSAQIKSHAAEDHTLGGDSTNMAAALTFHTNSGADSPVPERMRIDSQGRVGIGTTDTMTALSVNGGIKFGHESSSCSTSFYGTIRFNGTSFQMCDSSSNWMPLGGNGLTIGGNSPGGPLVAGTNNAEPLHLKVNNMVRMSIVDMAGIGIGTTAPDRSLDIFGDGINNEIRLNTAGSGMKSSLAFETTRGTMGSRSDLQTGDVLGEISFKGYHNNPSADILAIAPQNHSSNKDADLVFKTRDPGMSSPAERMRIDRFGKIGIGTANANAMVHVMNSAGGATATFEGMGPANQVVLPSMSSTNASELKFGRSNPSNSGNGSRPAQNDVIGEISFEGIASEISAFIKTVADTVHTGSSRNTKIVFATTAEGQTTPQPRMEILGNGTVSVNGHLASAGPAPTVSACGTGATVQGTDTRGKIVTGSANPTACTLTFSQSFPTAPFCVVSWASSPTGNVWVSSTTGTTMVVNFTTGVSGGNITYICMQ